MKFRTVLAQKEIQKPSEYIDYQSKIGLMGSCFVENIYKKMSYYKFPSWYNPYGIIFSPSAIQKALSDIIGEKKYSEKDLFYHNGEWHSWHHHSDFSCLNASDTLAMINSKIQETKKHLKDTSHLIITLGTAWVYHHIETDQMVANCHKVPQKQFIKKILSVREIIKDLEKTIALLRKINPELHIILTLSPVRHLKDGMLPNGQSKAHLLTAIHQVASQDDIYYFPSYEIIMDDLRDYRFFETDMLHPNKTAIDYVWSIFKEVWIAPKAFPIMEQVAQVQKGIQHKAFSPDSKQHKQFLVKLAEQKENLSKKYNIAF